MNPQTVPSNPTPHQRVAVVSIGRSGTSLLARILHEVLGVDFGEEKDHIPRNYNNPDGYFENREFLETNERILAAIGGAVLRPPAADFETNLAPQTRAELVAMVSDKLSAYSHDKPRFGWKDPRLSLTFPIWLAAEPGIVPIIVFRDPVSVLQSIAAQLSTEPDKLSGLWFEYYRRIFAYTAATPRLIVSFQQLVSAPLPTVLAMARHLHIEAQPAQWQAQLDIIVKPSQVHHKAPQGTLPAFIDPATEALHNYLEDCVGRGTQPTQQRLAELFGTR